MTSAINPSVTSSSNAATVSNPDNNREPNTPEPTQANSYYDSFTTTRPDASNDSTYNVSASDINPSANRNSILLADNRTPRQTTQDGRDRGNGISGAVGLVGGFIERRAIHNDINRVSDQIDQRIQQNGQGTGTLVSFTTNDATWLSRKTYAGMGVSSPQTTPPTGDFYESVGQRGQTTSYTWISDTKPANLPSNVGWMTPAQFRNLAAAYAI